MQVGRIDGFVFPVCHVDKPIGNLHHFDFSDFTTGLSGATALAVWAGFHRPCSVLYSSPCRGFNLPLSRPFGLGEGMDAYIYGNRQRYKNKAQSERHGEFSLAGFQRNGGC